MTLPEYPPESLHERLSAGLGNPGGARGSLTRCVGRFGRWQASLPDETASIAAAELLEREVEWMQLEMIKLALTWQRQQQEMHRLRDETRTLQLEMAHEESTVRALRLEAKQAVTTLSCLQEYESLAKIVLQKHPTSRRSLEQEQRKLQEQMEQTQRNLHTSNAQTRIRQAQFQHFLTALLDLKQSLTETEEEILDGDDGEIGEDANDDGEESEKSDKVESMEVVQEEVLYGDLPTAL
jgi:hypothetical protein